MEVFWVQDSWDREYFHGAWLDTPDEVSTCHPENGSLRRFEGGQKPAKTVRCVVLNGSAWNTEKKYVQMYKGAFDIFSGIEHGIRNDEMEETFNTEAKQGWTFVAHAARITDESASNEHRKHSFGTVVHNEEGAIMSIPGSERSIAQAWVNVMVCGFCVADAASDIIQN